VVRSAEIGDLLSEVMEVFEPLARREWLSWGGKLLFGRLQAEVDAEEKQEKKRRQEEEKEAERRRREEEKEAEQRRREEEKAGRLRGRREALVAARRAVLEDFRAKKVSKEELREKNARFTAEALEIEREEQVGEEEEEKDEAEIAAGTEGKRKASEGEIEGETEAKRARFQAGGLLEFEGPVSLLLFYLIVSLTLS
jgi:hypothetical protein